MHFTAQAACAASTSTPAGKWSHACRRSRRACRLNRRRTGQPDYPFILQVLREAPGEFRSHGPVDRDAGRAVEIEFNQSLDRLRAILNGWYERNDRRTSKR